ncbi:MAG: hypothetical protein HYY24_26150 [Verrucomicrobia bacterium]|nr:hypothetical protein [Verrucomicrobiota bacterium]
MSLINDALKRAKQAHAHRPAPTASGPPLQPVEGSSTSSRPTVGLWLAVALAVVFLAGWLFREWRAQADRVAARAETQKAIPAPRVAAQTPPAEPKPAPPPSVAPTPAVAPSAPPQPNVSAPAPTVEVTPAPVAQISPPPAAQPIIVKEEVPPAPPPLAPPPPPAKPAFPALKLQGIFFSRTKPSALISGQTLFLGDAIEGARVKAIEADKVIVEFQGESRTLNLR